LIRVTVETWPAGEREVVSHPGAVGVVALTDPGDVVLVRQFREAVRVHVLEIPAGILDVDGELPADAAARELFEETGHRARLIERLGEVLTSPGFADERIELFMAETPDDADGPGEPEVEVVRMPFAEALEAVRDGRIVDAKTVAGLSLTAARRGARWA